MPGASPQPTSPVSPGGERRAYRNDRTYDLSAQIFWKTYESPSETSHDYMFENTDSLAFTERGEALVHVTSFGLMLQSLENGVESNFFQLYSISRFHVIGTAFVFEALDQDTGFLNVHILDGSYITAKSIETGLSVAIQQKMESMDMKPKKQYSDNAYAEPVGGYSNAMPVNNYNYNSNRKTSFFSDVGSPPPRQGVMDYMSQGIQALGDLFKPARRRSSGAGRTRQISI
ncbi:hypothetical protein HOP50_10g60370 [Chloropicon primus]|uniref:Uncharacterized protein n=1 Tax=Chloropicon primus TaxID=1764295 RepID=A0A5B8MS01_9CHLO|nr:hypothetical protein A3770_10p60160 [Chloropicon primus]UPR02710.1 hypothetical protein HOP50_10g60370 [Chloropicon primus]|eukprot:QDZ23498.1 hypothetical protein A3770_10p60160 [Chloropicon primus]